MGTRGRRKAGVIQAKATRRVPPYQHYVAIKVYLG